MSSSICDQQSGRHQRALRQLQRIQVQDTGSGEGAERNTENAVDRSPGRSLICTSAFQNRLHSGGFLFPANYHESNPHELEVGGKPWSTSHS